VKAMKFLPKNALNIVPQTSMLPTGMDSKSQSMAILTGLPAVFAPHTAPALPTALARAHLRCGKLVRRHLGGAWLRQAATALLLALLWTSAAGQTSRAANLAAGQAAAGANQVSPGVAGVLLSQADAARTLGGYWRVHWGEDEQNFGVLQITSVNVADNQAVFEGQYSPDGLNTCRAIGNWVYSMRAAYNSLGATEVVELTNLMRMRLTCGSNSRETSIEAWVVPGNPLTLVGRAVHASGNQRQTQHMKMRRFGASN
jgi:hypothetical protein